MSIELIHLRKALRFCMMDDDKARSALRREAYEDRRRVEYPGEGGGDFFGPFWSDAKSYAIDGTNLEMATAVRIESHGGRRRLYSILCQRFIDWWTRYEGSMNEPLLPIDESVHTRYEFDELGITLKLDNFLALQIDRERHRLIYPYFSEQPQLSERWARVGLWIMTQAFAEYRSQDMVILDVQRARSFSTREIDLRGDEEAIFMARMSRLHEIWNELTDEVMR